MAEIRIKIGSLIRSHTKKIEGNLKVNPSEFWSFINKKKMKNMFF
jgi:hypothetical protein